MTSIFAIAIGLLPEYEPLTEENPEPRFQTDPRPGFYFNVHVIVCCRSMFNVMTPRSVHAGVSERRELNLFMLAPSFEFCTRLGFQSCCSNSFVVNALMKVNRFIKCFERWGDVSDPELLRVIIEMCPRLEIISVTPGFEYDEGYVSAKSQAEQVADQIDFLLKVTQSHPNRLARASAAACQQKLLFRYDNLVPTHSRFFVERDFMNIMVSNLLRDGMKDPSVIVSYLQAIRGFLFMENMYESKIALEDCHSFASFEKLFDFFESIFENGDAKILMPVPDLMEDLGYAVLSFVRASRARNEPANHNPVLLRKILFLRRYKSTLLPEIVNVLLSKDNGILNELNSTYAESMIAAGIDIISFAKDDWFFCEEAYPTSNDQASVSGLCPIAPTPDEAISRFKTMIEVNRRLLLQDLPLEPLVRLYERISQHCYYNNDDANSNNNNDQNGGSDKEVNPTTASESKEYFETKDHKQHKRLFELGMKLFNAGTRVGGEYPPVEYLPRNDALPVIFVWQYSKDTPKVFSSGLLQELLNFAAFPAHPESSEIESFFWRIFILLEDIYKAVKRSFEVPEFTVLQPNCGKWFLVNHRKPELGFEGSVLHALAKFCNSRFERSIAPVTDEKWKNEVFAPRAERKEAEKEHLPKTQRTEEEAAEDENNDNDEDEDDGPPPEIRNIVRYFKIAQATRQVFSLIYDTLLVHTSSEPSTKELLEAKQVQETVQRMEYIKKYLSAIEKKFLSAGRISQLPWGLQPTLDTEISTD